MTTDMSNKSVKEMALDDLLSNLGPFKTIDELALRLEEAQQRNAAHDAKVAAEALEEAIERLWERVGREEYGHAKAAVTLDIEAIRELAAEYRAKAKGDK